MNTRSPSKESRHQLGTPHFAYSRSDPQFSARYSILPRSLSFTMSRNGTDASRTASSYGFTTFVAGFDRKKPHTIHTTASTAITASTVLIGAIFCLRS
jgi:hypothetical protein